MEHQSNAIVWMDVLLQPSDFSRLVIRGERTIAIENEGDIVFRGDLSQHRLEAFIRNVCQWGGYSGIATRVLAHNSYAAIKHAFQNAINKLSQPYPDPGHALYEINQVSGLGKPSFASKHLRFLSPEVCPVFDSIIEKNSSYPYDEVGYGWFVEDCLKIAASLESCNTPNPMMRPQGKWYAADVEVALYRYLKYGRPCAG